MRVGAYRNMRHCAALRHCHTSICSHGQCHHRTRRGPSPPSGRDQHGSTQVPTVSARQLHSFLEVGKVFGAWIQDRIGSFGFVEGQDFVIVEGLISPNLARTSGGRPAKEYYLSIDMAKELSMVERNEKGKQARRYFIECEKRVMEGTTTSMGRTTSASNGVASTSKPIRLWWALQAAWEGHHGKGRRPRDVHPIGTIHHSLRLLEPADQTAVGAFIILRLLEPADQTAVVAINENDSLPTLSLI